MAPLYTPKQAAALLGISVSAVRLYTNTYTRYMSTEATGNPRRLTEADLRRIAFIVSKTSTGQAHERVLAHLDTDEGKQEYEAFDWDAPDADQEPTTALVPVAALQAAQALMLDAQRREQEGAQRERELQEQINQLLRELGMKEGELAAYKASKPKGFWARLLGGGE
jgi:DNA-binding transcriptional MerR regulator